MDPTANVPPSRRAPGHEAGWSDARWAPLRFVRVDDTARRSPDSFERCVPDRTCRACERVSCMVCRPSGLPMVYEHGFDHVRRLHAEERTADARWGQPGGRMMQAAMTVRGPTRLCPCRWRNDGPRHSRGCSRDGCLHRPVPVDAGDGPPKTLCRCLGTRSVGGGRALRNIYGPRSSRCPTGQGLFLCRNTRLPCPH